MVCRIGNVWRLVVPPYSPERLPDQRVVNSLQRYHRCVSQCWLPSLGIRWNCIRRSSTGCRVGCNPATWNGIKIRGTSKCWSHQTWERESRKSYEPINRTFHWFLSSLLLRLQSDHIRTIIKSRGLWHPNVNGKTYAVFRVDRKHHLMSLVSMLGMHNQYWRIIYINIIYHQYFLHYLIV